MVFHRATRVGLLAATALCGIMPRHADAADPSISGIEQQIRALQTQLQRVKGDMAARRAETEHARQTAEQARLEAQQANQRALALSGSQSFSGSQGSGVFQTGSNYPGTFSAQGMSSNGIGPHAAQTAGNQNASALGKNGQIRVGNVVVTLGGFFAAEAVERQRNIDADIGSSYNAIPYPSSATYHEPEFRGSARQSRIALLIEGSPSTYEKVAGYFATDFLSAGVSSNSNESNSYSLRIREAYATYDNGLYGFHMLGGQSWSLLTLNRVGITPRQENVPLTIDAQYVVGFNWARQWQLRFVKDFNKKVWLGVSFEEPQTVYSVTTQNVNGANNVGGVIGGVSNFYNTGGSLLNSTANYSTDIAPDIIAKLAVDPGFGHYELDGLARFEYARETLSAPAVNSGNNRTALAGGVGAGLLLPIVGKQLVFQASGLAGQGIGRYGSGQLADATINQNGTPIPIPEVEALFGLVYHPTKAWDLYAYAGTEQQERRSFNERIGGKTYAFGYGNELINDTGCNTEGGSCGAVTRGLVDGTAGAWWRFLQGPFGALEVGTEWEYIRKTAFQGTSTVTVGKTSVSSPVTPKTDDNMVLFSFRYLPFL